MKIERDYAAEYAETHLRQATVFSLPCGSWIAEVPGPMVFTWWGIGASQEAALRQLRTVLERDFYAPAARGGSRR